MFPVIPRFYLAFLLCTLDDSLSEVYRLVGLDLAVDVDVNGRVTGDRIWIVGEFRRMVVVYSLLSFDLVFFLYFDAIAF